MRSWFHRRSRAQSIGLYAAAAFAGTLIVAFLILISPITSIIVTPRIAAAIEAQLGPGYAVYIGSSRVDITTDGLDLKFNGFEIRDPGGVKVLGVPSAAIALENLVVSQRVSLRRLKLTQPQLTLRIETSGEVVLAGTDGGPPLFSLPAADVPQAAPAEIFGFLAAADAVLKQDGPLANFEFAEILSASITIDDQRRGRIERLESVDIRVRRGKNNALTASAASASVQERWAVSATLSGEPGGERNFDLGFENLSLGRITYELARDKAQIDLSGQLFGHVYARLGPNGEVPAAEARLDVVGFAAIDRERPDGRMDVDRTRAELSWSGKDRRLKIGSVEVAPGSSRFILSGQARPLDAANDVWDFSLVGSERLMPGADPKTHILRFDRIDVDGRVERTAKKLILEKASVQGRSLSVAGYGSLDFSGEKPMADFAIAGSRSPLAAVLRVWPGLIAPGTRKWVSENVSGGMVEDMSIAVRGPLGGRMLRREIALDARFTDATVQYLDETPPAVEAHGYVRVVNETMETVIEGGRIEVAGSDPLSVAGTRFSTQDHRPIPIAGELATRIEGPVASVGALMSVPRLARLAPGVAPLMRGNGTVAIALGLTGPYGPGVDPSKLVLRINAGLSGWSMAKAIGNRDVDNGNFTLTIDPGTANLRGELRFSGAPIAVEAILNRTPDNKFADTVVRFSLDPSKMKDFDNEALRIAGPISAELVQDAPGVLANSRMRADLTSAAIEGPVGLAKAAGAPGQVSFTLQPRDENWRLENFIAQGSGMDIRGTVELAKAGGLSSAQFSRFGMSPGDDAKLDVTKTGNAYKIAVKGSSFNAQPILKDVISGEPEKRALDIDVEAKLGTVIGHNGESLTGADFKLSRRNNTTRALNISGQIGSGAIEGRSAGDDAQRVLSLRAGDAGAMLRFIDVYRRMRGGVLTLDVMPGQTSSGTIRIQSFQVVGDQQLTMVASNKPEQRASGGTQSFTRMDSKFRLGGGRILIDDFEVYGNELGATLGGEINYAQDKVGISGTFVPAYALNNLFGKVPLFGALLGGGSGGGLVGITFAIDGAWSNPQMRVNPLSAVAPGFLRKIFEFRTQNPSTTGSAPAPQGQPTRPQ